MEEGNAPGALPRLSQRKVQTREAWVEAGQVQPQVVQRGLDVAAQGAGGAAALLRSGAHVRSILRRQCPGGRGGGSGPGGRLWHFGCYLATPFGSVTAAAAKDLVGHDALPIRLTPSDAIKDFVHDALPIRLASDFVWLLLPMPVAARNARARRALQLKAAL